MLRQFFVTFLKNIGIFNLIVMKWAVGRALVG
jgi:hypothetical protein